MSFERRVAMFIALLIAALMISTALITNRTIISSERDRLTRDMQATQRLYRGMEEDRFIQLTDGTNLLSALPQMRALLGTGDSATIEDSFTDFKGWIHADILAYGDGKNVHAGITEWGPFDPLLKGALQSGEPVTGYVESGGVLYQAVALPVRAGVSGSGVLVAGYRFGEENILGLENRTRNHFALRLGGGKVIHSARTPIDDRTMESAESTRNKSVPVIAGEFLVLTLPLSAPAGAGKVADLVMYRPISEGLQTARRLQWNVMGISLLFGFAAIFLGFAVARGLSRPLRELSHLLSGAAKKVTRHGEVADALVSVSEQAGQFSSDPDYRRVLDGYRDLIDSIAVQREQIEERSLMRARQLEKTIHSLERQNQSLARANADLRDLLLQENEKELKRA